MNFVAVIELISSIVTIAEAGRDGIVMILDKIKKKGITLNEWHSDNPEIQSRLDEFKTSMEKNYKEYIFSDSDIEELIQEFFSNNKIPLDNEDRKEIEQFIREIIEAHNICTESRMSPGEKVLHNEMASDYSKIMDKLDVIQKQPEKENIKKFLRAVEKSKDIELDNIEVYINGEYEIDRSSFIESIQRNPSRIVSIQGNAGSGKSVICKKLISNKDFVLVTRAENFTSEKSLT